MAAEVILGRNFAENSYHMAIIRRQMTRKIPEFLPDILDEVKVSFERFMPILDSTHHLIQVQLHTVSHLTVHCLGWEAYNPNEVISHIVCESINRICIGIPYCKYIIFDNKGPLMLITG